MKLKKIISFFLLLVLCIQVLPFKQIAVWLFSNQVTEELAHDINPVKANSGKEDAFPFNTFHDDIFEYSLTLIVTTVNRHIEESTYNRHADDILSPPPNI